MVIIITVNSLKLSVVNEELTLNDFSILSNVKMPVIIEPEVIKNNKRLFYKYKKQSSERIYS